MEEIAGAQGLRQGFQEKQQNQQIGQAHGRFFLVFQILENRQGMNEQAKGIKQLFLVRFCRRSVPQAALPQMDIAAKQLSSHLS